MTSPSSPGAPPSRRPSLLSRASLRSLTRALTTLILLSALALCIAWFAFPLDPSRLAQIPQARRVLDRDGRLLRLETGVDGTLAIPVSLDQTSPWLAKAIM